ncbi:MAG: hypothetical protein ACE5KO_00620 [Candidatus Bathyarchaeia archaeon]
MVIAIVITGLVGYFVYQAYPPQLSTPSPTDPADSINVSIESSVYNFGEPVRITISNNGVYPITFRNAAFGLRILDAATLSPVFTFVSAQVLTELQPKIQKTFIWNQIGIDGNQLPPGDYLAEVSGISSEGYDFAVTAHFAIE